MRFSAVGVPAHIAQARPCKHTAAHARVAVLALPPGNSQRPAIARPSGRCASSTRRCASISATATTSTTFLAPAASPAAGAAAAAGERGRGRRWQGACVASGGSARCGGASHGARAAHCRRQDGTNSPLRVSSLVEGPAWLAIQRAEPRPGAPATALRRLAANNGFMEVLSTRLAAAIGRRGGSRRCGGSRSLRAIWRQRRRSDVDTCN